MQCFQEELEAKVKVRKPYEKVDAGVEKASY